MFIILKYFIFLQFVKGENLLLKVQKHYDILIFTQAWPPTSCYEWEEKSLTHKCNLPPDQEWSIHGLWPSKNGTLGPFFCNDSLHFDLSALNSIREQLELKWIDVHKGVKPYEFWRHEWEKHGTCSVDLVNLNTEKKYFEKGLELLDKYNMKHTLSKASILPNQKYLLKIYLDGVHRILGKRPYIECTNNKKKNEIYLSELRICLNKKFELIDCNGIYQYPGNCNKKKKIIYPGSVPNSIIQPLTIQI